MSQASRSADIGGELNADGSNVPTDQIQLAHVSLGPLEAFSCFICFGVFL